MTKHYPPQHQQLEWLVRAIKFFVFIQELCLRFSYFRVNDNTVINWAQRRTLWFVKMAHTFGAQTWGNFIIFNPELDGLIGASGLTDITVNTGIKYF